MMKFRRLRASEIDARVATVTESGVSLLLYKDARVDQNILDETVGPENWQRSHEVINGNLFCNVGIRVDRHDGYGEWVWKQDVGTESYTEKEKGQASDSFKRACFNWGIGRELYTAPFIWVTSGKVSLENYKGKLTTKDRFSVDEIGYDEAGNINRLVIRNTKKNIIVYQLGEAVTEEQKAEKHYDDVREQKISKTDLSVVKKRYKTDEQQQSILKHFKLDTLEDMTVSQFVELRKVMEGTNDSKGNDSKA